MSEASSFYQVFDCVCVVGQLLEVCNMSNLRFLEHVFTTWQFCFMYKNKLIVLTQHEGPQTS